MVYVGEFVFDIGVFVVEVLVLVVKGRMDYEKVLYEVSRWNMCARWFETVRGCDHTSVILSSHSERSWFVWLSFSFFECGSSFVSAGVSEDSISLVELVSGVTSCWCEAIVV